MTMYCTGKLLNNLPWTKAMSFRICDDTLRMLLSGECNCKALKRERVSVDQRVLTNFTLLHLRP